MKKRIILAALALATLAPLAGCVAPYGYYRDGYYDRGYYGDSGYRGYRGDGGYYGRYRDGYEYNRGYNGGRRYAPYADYDYGYDD